MNTPDQPLSQETLDELLSADIDGELERAAEELGFTLEGARAAVASPDAAIRRDALVHARDVLATRAELEPDDAARLVAAALARADEHRAAPQPVVPLSKHRFRNARRALIGIGTAAAVIAGVVALSASNPASQSKSSIAASSAATTAPALGAPKNTSRSVAFGAVTPPSAFHLRVQAELAQQKHIPEATSAGKTAQSPTANATPPGSADSALGPTNGTTTLNAPAGADIAKVKRLDCIASLARNAGVTSAPVLSGSGTKGAEPVYVVVYKQASSYLVYVLSAADCSVVSRAPLP
jgi:hypothetical protein